MCFFVKIWWCHGKTKAGAKERWVKILRWIQDYFAGKMTVQRDITMVYIYIYICYSHLSRCCKSHRLLIICPGIILINIDSGLSQSIRGIPGWLSEMPNLQDHRGQTPTQQPPRERHMHGATSGLIYMSWFVLIFLTTFSLLIYIYSLRFKCQTCAAGNGGTQCESEISWRSCVLNGSEK